MLERGCLLTLKGLTTVNKKCGEEEEEIIHEKVKARLLILIKEYTSGQE
jgi:hypothetical protein